VYRGEGVDVCITSKRKLPVNARGRVVRRRRCLDSELTVSVLVLRVVPRVDATCLEDAFGSKKVRAASNDGLQLPIRDSLLL
jgi:hypothetical protein